jgi:hypothetical protein
MGLFCKNSEKLMQKIKAKLGQNEGKSLMISTKEKVYFYENIRLQHTT